MANCGQLRVVGKSVDDDGIHRVVVYLLNEAINDNFYNIQIQTNPSKYFTILFGLLLFLYLASPTFISTLIFVFHFFLIQIVWSTTSSTTFLSCNSILFIASCCWRNYICLGLSFTRLNRGNICLFFLFTNLCLNLNSFFNIFFLVHRIFFLFVNDFIGINFKHNLNKP